ncbi:MAG: hypothetical protein HYU52_05015 [Acidobacteria bacterium]|nr:hypothetical protein [Acidobacteriota bacterium]
MTLLAFFQSTNMTEEEFRALITKVVVSGTLAMGIAAVLLWLFWRNLGKESEGGESETRVSTWLLLVSLVVVLLALSFVVYSLA